jgi:FkbM family methyltransferase
MKSIRSGMAPYFYRGAEVKAVAIDGLGELKFALHSREDIWLSDVLRKGQVVEWHIYLLLREFLQSGDCFLDIGANIGWFTVTGSRLVGDRGRVLAVEPDLFNLRLLRRNLRLNGCNNVEVFPVAVGDRPGKATLYRSSDNQGDHQLAICSDRPDHVRVRVTTIDQLLQKWLQKVDFIKIDTQGSEAAILRGMSELLEHPKRIRMVLEFWPQGLENCGASVETLVASLVGFGGRYWLLHGDNTTEPVDPSQLLELGRGRYASASGAHTDIVRADPGDEALIEYLAALERGAPL